MEEEVKDETENLEDVLKTGAQSIFNTFTARAKDIFSAYESTLKNREDRTFKPDSLVGVEDAYEPKLSKPVIVPPSKPTVTEI